MSKLVKETKNFVSEKVENIKKPEASVADVELMDVSLDSITYKAKVSVENPYSVPIPISKITYTLKSAGRVVASGTLEEPGKLPANETTELEVPVKVPHSVMVDLVRDIGSDWDIDYELDLGITIDLPIVGGFTIPISSKGKIKLPILLSDLWNKG
ncbi:hypothetical protein U1Q18_003606 [Sarracenia purpurea var. burkii]